ncbi:Serine hydroxymethyltransferase 4 [Sesbania bispinosa]|nr:Serine hydroxymethyltransferase 4 [Sesbania bispinosa]
MLVREATKPHQRRIGIGSMSTKTLIPVMMIPTVSQKKQINKQNSVDLVSAVEEHVKPKIQDRIKKKKRRQCSDINLIALENFTSIQKLSYYNDQSLLSVSSSNQNLRVVNHPQSQSHTYILNQLLKMEYGCKLWIAPCTTRRGVLLWSVWFEGFEVWYRKDRRI